MSATDGRPYLTTLYTFLNVASDGANTYFEKSLIAVWLNGKLTNVHS